MVGEGGAALVVGGRIRAVCSMAEVMVGGGKERRSFDAGGRDSRRVAGGCWNRVVPDANSAAKKDRMDTTFLRAELGCWYAYYRREGDGPGG